MALSNTLPIFDPSEDLSKLRAIVVGDESIYGKSKQLLLQALSSAGLTEEAVFVTDTATTSSILGYDPFKEPTHSDLFSQAIEHLPREIPVLVCGASASKELCRVDSILAERGGYKLVNNRWYIPTLHPAYVLRNPETVRDFASDIFRLSRGPACLRYPKLGLRLPHYIITDIEVAERAVRTYLERGGRTVLDIETTELIPDRGKVMTYGFAQSAESSIIITAEAFEALPRDLLVEFFTSGKCLWSGHNAADFEFIWIKVHLGIEIIFDCDTLLLHVTIDERSGGEEEGWSSTSYHSLKMLQTALLDVPDYYEIVKPWIPQDGPEKGTYKYVPLKELALYQALDCCGTFALEIELNAMHDCLETSTALMKDLLIPAVNMLRELEYDGSLVDIPYLEELADVYEQRAQQVEIELSSLVGRPINVRSPKQLSELLYDELRLPSVDKRSPRGTGGDILDKLLFKFPHLQILKKIKDCRLIKTIRSTYILGLIKRVDPYTGRVHTSFIIFGAATGRLSSRNPNFQNIPKLIGPDIRRAFIAEEGYSIVDADYSQLELRIWAILSKCPDLLEIFLNDYDLHSEVAMSLTGKTDPKTITYEERDIAKCLNFGIPYGRQAESVEEGLERTKMYLLQGMSEQAAYAQAIADAEEYIRLYRERFPVGIAFLDANRKRIYSPKNGGTGEQYVETLTGRRRRFPLVTDINCRDCENQAVNSPIQGTASDVALMAGIRLRPKFQQLNANQDRYLAKKRLFVHDSIVSTVRDDCLEEVCAMIKSTMEERVFDTPVPLKAEVKVGKNWGDVD